MNCVVFLADGSCLIPMVPCYSRFLVNRRAFLKKSGRSLLFVGAVTATASCDPFKADESASKTLFSYDFDGSGTGWSPRWLNVRYAGHLERGEGQGIVHVGPAPGRALGEGAPRTEYMAQPIVLEAMDFSDVKASVSIAIEGSVEAGLIACWDHDRAYALLIGASEIYLVRYDVDDRRVLRRATLPAAGERWRLALSVDEGRLRGRVTGDGGERVLVVSDSEPLRFGAVGVVVNPTDAVEGGMATFRSFRVTSRREPAAPEARFVYRFAGAVVAGKEGIRTRLTARTVYPRPIGFEIARDESFTDGVAIEPSEPEGKWGSVHAWAEGLEEGAEYFWRPFVAEAGERRVGRTARFTTPAPRRAIRFAFASCTSGKSTDYSSFETAASFDPEFYLHAGDFGYPNLTSLAHSPDHFQHRWTRLLRTTEVDSLIARTPLMFWQDDHDYQSDNGWAETCMPYTVWSFDELHANPTNVYFDLRWGDLHVWCLDCRLFATDPDAPDNASKSRLGQDQKRWLKEGMARSDAPVRVVASPMVFRNKDPDDQGWHNDYITEREELLAFFADLDATVFILSGDAHGHRLIHHFEFGELFEVTASGTDFPESTNWGHKNYDPDHTIHQINDRTGFALVDLDPPGPGRRVTIRSVSTHHGDIMFKKSLPVSRP